MAYGLFWFTWKFLVLFLFLFLKNFWVEYLGLIKCEIHTSVSSHPSELSTLQSEVYGYIKQTGLYINSGVLNIHNPPPLIHNNLYGPTSPLENILNFAHNFDSEIHKKIDWGFERFNYKWQPLKGTKMSQRVKSPWVRKKSNRMDWNSLGFWEKRFQVQCEGICNQASNWFYLPKCQCTLGKDRPMIEIKEEHRQQKETTVSWNLTQKKEFFNGLFLLLLFFILARKRNKH